MSRSACEISLTASLSDASGARSKLMVTAGNCSWCAITSGAVVYSKRAMALSGICELPAVEITGAVGLEVSDVEVATAWLPDAGT